MAILAKVIVCGERRISHCRMRCINMIALGAHSVHGVLALKQKMAQSGWNIVGELVEKVLIRLQHRNAGLYGHMLHRCLNDDLGHVQEPGATTSG